MFESEIGMQDIRFTKALRTSSFDWSNTFHQDGFPLPEKQPVLSAPDNAWNPNKASAFNSPMLL